MSTFLKALPKEGSAFFLESLKSLEPPERDRSLLWFFRKKASTPVQCFAKTGATSTPSISQPLRLEEQRTPNGEPVPSSHDPNPVIREFEVLRQTLAGHVAGGTVLSGDRAMGSFGDGQCVAR
jgi:hypothetical protein